MKINLFQRNEIPCYIIFVQKLNFWKWHLYSKITVTQTNTIDAPRSPTQMVRLISCIKSMWSTYLVHFTQFNAGTAAFKSLHLPLNELLLCSLIPPPPLWLSVNCNYYYYCQAIYEQDQISIDAIYCQCRCLMLTFDWSLVGLVSAVGLLSVFFWSFVGVNFPRDAIYRI